MSLDFNGRESDQKTKQGSCLGGDPERWKRYQELLDREDNYWRADVMKRRRAAEKATRMANICCALAGIILAGGWFAAYLLTR